jgi:hypothetical protein
VAGGPVGGIAASMVGGQVGGASVRFVKRLFHHEKKPVEAPIEQAAAAPEAGADTSATEPVPAPITATAEPPAPTPLPATEAATAPEAPAPS